MLRINDIETRIVTFPNLIDQEKYARFRRYLKPGQDSIGHELAILTASSKYEEKDLITLTRRLVVYMNGNFYLTSIYFPGYEGTDDPEEIVKKGLLIKKLERPIYVPSKNAYLFFLLTRMEEDISYTNLRAIIVDPANREEPMRIVHINVYDFISQVILKCKDICSTNKLYDVVDFFRFKTFFRRI